MAHVCRCAVKPYSNQLITFGLAPLPQYTKLAYLRIPVEIHNPMKCFVCQILGHHVLAVVQRPMMTSPVKHQVISTVGQAHNAYSKDCSRWKQIFQRIKCLSNVSFPEPERSLRLPTQHPHQVKVMLKWQWVRPLAVLSPEQT